MGGTIEDIYHDRQIRLRALPGILSVLEGQGIVLPGTHDEILESMLAGNAAYKALSEAERREYPTHTIWVDWNLRDFDIPAAKIEPVSEHLAFLYETTFFSRKLRPDAVPTLAALAERGYRLGVISNTSSLTQVFFSLEEYGIASYFESVILSSTVGLRKPHPGIFKAALDAMGLEPQETAYVGDTLSRDVVGARLSGFALAFQIRSFLTGFSDASLAPGSPQPDHLIQDLASIVGILDRYKGRGSSL
jgi:putative hydrolase of the HAD superfamily